jgi:hypothetical protein
LSIKTKNQSTDSNKPIKLVFTLNGVQIKTFDCNENIEIAKNESQAHEFIIQSDAARKINFTDDMITNRSFEFHSSNNTGVMKYHSTEFKIPASNITVDNKKTRREARRVAKQIAKEAAKQAKAKSTQDVKVKQ